MLRSASTAFSRRLPPPNPHGDGVVARPLSSQPGFPAKTGRDHFRPEHTLSSLFDPRSLLPPKKNSRVLVPKNKNTRPLARRRKENPPRTAGVTVRFPPARRQNNCKRGWPRVAPNGRVDPKCRVFPLPPKIPLCSPSGGRVEDFWLCSKPHENTLREGDFFGEIGQEKRKGRAVLRRVSQAEGLSCDGGSFFFLKKKKAKKNKLLQGGRCHLVVVPVETGRSLGSEDAVSRLRLGRGKLQGHLAWKETMCAHAAFSCSRAFAGSLLSSGDTAEGVEGALTLLTRSARWCKENFLCQKKAWSLCSMCGP